MIKLRENKGILLVSTFVVAAVLSVLSGAYVTSALVQNQASQKQRESLGAFYAAEKGLAYVYIESENRGWNWVTHEIAATDLDGDGQVNDLIPTATPPNVILAGASINTTAGSNCPGCYEIATPLGTVQLKAYTNPQNPDETIVLSSDTNGSVSRLLKYRMSRRSLYKYFYYYSTGREFAGTNFDGKNAGGIYVNGDIILIWGVYMNNIKELSTNSSSTIRVKGDGYSPPYFLDDRDGVRDGKAPLYTLINGSYIYSLSNPYPMGPGWPPGDLMNVDARFYGISKTAAARINGVDLPRTLPTSWDWTKYSGNYNLGYDVQFYDSNGNLATQAYWDDLANRTWGVNGFDPAFWSDKTYKKSSAIVSVNYLNTDKQTNDWNAWLDSTGINLKGVVKEKNSGGYDTNIPKIQANYSTLAKGNGLYIGKDASGQTEVYLNGQNLGNSLPAWISDNVQFWNTLRAKDRDGDGKVDKENVLELDISQTLNLPTDQLPGNGIIYIDSKNLRLVNASKLPKSLTIVSPYNVYIKGDYNTDSSWKPSAVITNSLVYLLSNDFNGDTLQRLPAKVNPRVHPSELSWIDLSKFTPGTTPQDIQNMKILEDEIERFFALRNNFEISAPGLQPQNMDELNYAIQNKYATDYQSLMPNMASSTTFNLGMATPFEPSGYQLERWGYQGNGATLTIKGAFLQLPSSWVDDANGNPIRDVPPEYGGRRPDYTGNIIPRPNNQGQDPCCDDPYHNLYTVSPYTEYEDRFVSQRPAGDFFAGSQPLWEEASDFNHHI